MHAELGTLRRDATDVLAHIPVGADLIVPLANGEPRTVLDAIDAHADRLRNVRVHQMHALHDHPYLHGAYGDRFRHVSYFLSPLTRPLFHEGGLEHLPAHFSEVPAMLRRHTKCSLVLAAASPPDHLGYFSLGTNADYVARLIGKAPFFLEVNPNMPRTFGENNIHVSQIVGWCEADYPLIEIEPVAPSEKDLRIGGAIAERVPDGATIQVGIGGIPNAAVAQLANHRDLGLHSELLSDSVVELWEAGVLTGAAKRLRPGKLVATFSLGTRKVYDFIHESAAVELLPVDWVNDPRTIGREDRFVSVNATTEVDLLGQAVSETIGGRLYSGSGGQADFARGAMYAEHGQGFLALHSTAKDDTVSRITPALTSGSVVTTLKNTVDCVVTEYGVAELRGRTVRERARALIAVAHPRFRDELEREAHRLGYLHE